MTVLVFAVTAFLVGTLLGLRFKVYILLPVIIASLAAIVGVGFKYESGIGFVLFVTFLCITTLQLGYLFGSLIGVYVAASSAQKGRSQIIETVQQLFRQSQT